jgi:hypothetical protein
MTVKGFQENSICCFDNEKINIISDDAIITQLTFQLNFTKLTERKEFDLKSCFYNCIEKLKN